MISPDDGDPGCYSCTADGNGELAFYDGVDLCLPCLVAALGEDAYPLDRMADA